MKRLRSPQQIKNTTSIQINMRNPVLEVSGNDLHERSS